MHIKDKYGRSFKTLRVSLTSVCNLSCTYCTNNETNQSNSHKNQKNISPAEIARLVQVLHNILKFNTLRITGGEPTIYPHLIEFAHAVSKFGVPHLKMTTNGYRLQQFIQPLSKLGLTHLNISLDATQESTFNKISNRTNLNRILNAIDQALELGVRVKLNAVIIKGVNEHEIIPLMDFAQERGIVIRYLELMRMGPMHEEKVFQQYFISQQQILDTLSSKYSFVARVREQSATAQYWIMEQGTEFGIIANESEPFCSDCDRLRLDSFGNIFGCLSKDEAISLLDTNLDENKIILKLQEALKQKQINGFTGSKLSMLDIGG